MFLETSLKCTFDSYLTTHNFATSYIMYKYMFLQHKNLKILRKIPFNNKFLCFLLLLGVINFVLFTPSKNDVPLRNFPLFHYRKILHIFRQIQKFSPKESYQNYSKFFMAPRGPNTSGDCCLEHIPLGKQGRFPL